MKKFFALLLVLMLIVSMGACGKKIDDETGDSQATNPEKDQKVTVEKGDWIPASLGNMSFEVRDNWTHEKRDAVEIEYYYFDETKNNYLLVSFEAGYEGLLENSKEGFDSMLGGQIESKMDIEFKEKGIVTVGKDIGGFKFVYTDTPVYSESEITFTEFYSVYNGSIYWFYASVKEEYLEDYMDDLDHFFSSLQTVSGEGNPIIE